MNLLKWFWDKVEVVLVSIFLIVGLTLSWLLDKILKNDNMDEHDYYIKESTKFKKKK